MKYEFTEGFHNRGGISPQLTGEHLEGLRKKLGRKLTAEDVLKSAKAHRSPIHQHFEWDDTEAAKQHRLAQARELVRHVAVLVPVQGEAEPRKVRAFLHVENEESGYESLKTTLKDPEYRKQVIARAFKEFESWQKRYQDLEELAGIFKAAERVRKKAS